MLQEDFNMLLDSFTPLDIEIEVGINGTIPTRSTDGSAGYDLYAAEDGVVWDGEQHLIKTDISIAIPKGYVGIIKDRSGLAFKNRIVTNAGVIDSDYRGEIGVVLSNEEPNEEFYYFKGDRIAQILFIPVEDVVFSVVDELLPTERGEGGYGHTGK